MARSNCGDGSGKKGDSGNSQRKGAPKAKGASAAGARKYTKKAASNTTPVTSTKNATSITTPVTKRRKKNSDANPLFVDPPDDAYAPYFKEFEGKRAPNFTTVEDLVLCKSYAAVSEDPTVGTDQTAETFWGELFESFVLLSAYETENGTFYKRSPKSLKDRFARTIQPSMNTFNRYFKNVKNRKISGVGSDDELYDIAAKEYEEGEEKSFPFCECAKILHEMPRFDPMIDPATLVLADKTTLSKGEASNLAPPMGAGMGRPTGVKAAKRQIEEQRMQNFQLNDANESMRKMAASHDKMASVMFRKQELLEKQGKLASLWKLQEYYAATNQFAKMASVMIQIEALTDSLAENNIATNNAPDDGIDINSDISVEEDGDRYGESGNDDNVEVESADDQDPDEHVEEVEEVDGDKTPEEADDDISEDAEDPDELCED